MALPSRKQTGVLPISTRTLTLALVMALTLSLGGAASTQPAPRAAARAAAKLPGVKAGPRRAPTLGARKTALTPLPSKPGDPKARRVKRAPTGPTRTTRATAPRLPKAGEPLAPGRPAGQIKRDVGGLPPGFDPTKLGKEDKPSEEKKAEGDERKIEDMIVFNSNYERGIKCQKLPLSTQISLDFEDAPLGDVIKFIGCITARNFIIGKSVGKGKTITIMSPRPVTAYEAYKVFLVALEMNAMTVVPSGRFLKIMDMGSARQDMVPILRKGERLPDDESLVTRVIELEHIDASEIQAVLGKFKTKHGDITVYAPTNTIFLTDLSANIRRMLKLIHELDVPMGRERVWVRQVEYAEASALVDKITAVFGAQATARKKPTRSPARTTARTSRARKGARTPAPSAPTTVGEPSQVQVSKVLADDRTNQLIIVANPTSYFKLDKLIRKLDVPIPGEGSIHIHPLENADAEEIAQTLSQLVQSGGSSRTTKRRLKTAKKTTKRAAGGGAAALFEGDVRITAYKPMNSLIIQASLKDYTSLKLVIEKLDSPRKQVYVEAIIMEVTSSKDRKLGLSGSGGATFDVGGETVPLLLGMGGLGISGLDMQQLTKGGMAVGLQGPLLDVSAGSGTGGALTGTLSIPSFGALLQAIQSNSDVNILSTPHILTTDNEEAEIQVGKQIPYLAQTGGLGGLSSLASLGGMAGLGGSRSSMGGLGALGSLGSLGGMGGFGSVQRIDVDLTLKITPHVNDGNYVKLETDLQIDDVESIDRTLGPTTSKRHVTNVVVVRDQQPVVIGGLIRDTETRAVDKVPLLGDIPVLGILFRKTSTRIEKKNLLMIIIPHIIEDPAKDLARIHEQRMEEMRRFSEYMSTRKKEYLGEIDYDKKHGALEVLHQTIMRARREREAQERALFDDSDMDTVGPPETHDIEYDPYKDAKPKKRAPHPGREVEAPVVPGAAAEPDVDPATDVVPKVEPLL